MNSSSKELSMTALDVRTRSPWVAFCVLAGAQFLLVLDVSVVLVALPSIQDSVGFSQTGLAWVLNAYGLTFGGFLLLGGRAADVFGHRRVLICGLGALTVTSVLCAVSAEPWQLVAARAGQGLSAAVACPAAMALVLGLFTSQGDRNKGLSIFASVGAVSGVLGTAVGGPLTSVGWQWVFLFNAPVAVVLLVATLRLVPSPQAHPSAGMDLVGSITGTAGMCVLIWAVLHGDGAGWTAPATLVGFVAAVALLALFAVRQVKATAPLIPRELFRLPTVVFGNLANLMVGALMFGIFMVLTLHLQQDRGFSPVDASLSTLPICVALFVGSQALPRVLGRVSPPVALAGTLAVLGAGLLWWSMALSTDGNIVTAFMLPGMVWSFGAGAGIVAGYVVCTAGVEGPAAGAASGLVNTTLQVGGAIGIAIFSTIAVAQTDGLLANGTPREQALTSGNASAFVGGVVLAAIGVAFAVTLARRTRQER
jgi:MFS family permease